VTTSGDNTARIWDPASGKSLGELRGLFGSVDPAALSPDWLYTARDEGRVQPSGPNAVFSPDGSRVLSGGGDGPARAWDAGPGNVLLELKGHTDWIRSAAFSPDGSRVLTGSRDGTARVWDAKTGKVLLELKGHTDVVRSAVFSPDGSRVVTAGSDW